MKLEIPRGGTDWHVCFIDEPGKQASRLTVAEELRLVGPQWWRLKTIRARFVWDDAARSLGLFEYEGTTLGHFAIDVSSEAIEAAEALGL